MNTQPEALRLADALDDGTYLLSQERDATAAELRRLHEENSALRREVAALSANALDDYKMIQSLMAERQPLTVAQAHDMGAKGGEPTEAERLLFEAWMRGHCWKVCGTWDGKQYRSPTEVNGEVDYHAMHTRQLWAAWRDRAALEAAHGIKGEV